MDIAIERRNCLILYATFKGKVTFCMDNLIHVLMSIFFNFKVNSFTAFYTFELLVNNEYNFTFQTLSCGLVNKRMNSNDLSFSKFMSKSNEHFMTSKKFAIEAIQE